MADITAVLIPLRVNCLFGLQQVSSMPNGIPSRLNPSQGQLPLRTRQLDSGFEVHLACLNPSQGQLPLRTFRLTAPSTRTRRS